MNLARSLAAFISIAATSMPLGAFAQPRGEETIRGLISSLDGIGFGPVYFHHWH